MRKKKYCYDYPRPMVTADCAIFRIHKERLELLLVRRKKVQEGAWALPGGFVGMNEGLEAAALRELREETGLDNVSVLMQLWSYGAPDRDPRGRVITVAHIGVVGGAGRKVKGGSDAGAAEWHAVEDLPQRLAFDHSIIIQDAVQRLAMCAAKGMVFGFLKKRFALSEFGSALKAVYGVALDPKPYLKPFIEDKVVKTLGGDKYLYVGGKGH